MARYCSQFCQHKDWEGHHKVCTVTKEKLDHASNSRSSKEATATENVPSPEERVDILGNDDNDEEIEIREEDVRAKEVVTSQARRELRSGSSEKKKGD